MKPKQRIRNSATGFEPCLGIQKWTRRLLDHLLVPSLDGALALVEVDRVAVFVAHNLENHKLFSP